MTREVRLLQVTLEIEVDANQLDNLPPLDWWNDYPSNSHVPPLDGALDLQQRVVDGCIREALKLFEIARVNAHLEDASSKLGPKYEQSEYNADFFY
jgi:hypothetical protein